MSLGRENLLRTESRENELYQGFGIRETFLSVLDFRPVRYYVALHEKLITNFSI
jgi:hypothetical protein